MRLRHIDIARGLCIILVAWGHNGVLAPPDSAFNEALRLFRMPLLFFIAGTFFQPHQSLGRLALNKADALLKPFLVIAALQAPLRIGFFEANPIDYLVGTLSGSGNYLPWLFALWFLPHLWAVFVFSQFLLTLTQLQRRHWTVQCALLAAMMALGWWALPSFWQKPVSVFGLPFQLQGLPLSLDLLPISGTFFLIGFLIQSQVKAMRFQPGGLILATAAFAAAISLGNPAVILLGRIYQDPLWATVGALSGIAMALYLASGLATHERIARRLAHCGRESLFILIFHSPIQSLSMKVWSHLTGQPPSWPVGLAAFVTCIAGSLLAARTIRRHLWLSMGFLPLSSLRNMARGVAADPLHALARPVSAGVDLHEHIAAPALERKRA